MTKYHYRAGVFQWRDQNGNGAAEETEVEEYEGTAPISNGWGCGVGPDMSLYLVADFATDNRHVAHFRLTGFDARGNPMYDVPGHRRLLEGELQGDVAFALGPAGEMYVADNLLRPAQPPVWGGMETVRDIHLKKYDRTGATRLWKTGRKARDTAQPGEAYRISSIAGIARGHVFFVDVNGQERVYTDDGLYVASLLEDPFREFFREEYMQWVARLRTRDGRTMLAVEQFGAKVFEHRPSNTLYLMAGSDGIHFWRIEGLDRLHRFSGRTVPCAVGDLNCDGQINALDVQLCTNTVTNPSAVSPKIRERVSRWAGSEDVPPAPRSPTSADCTRLARRIFSE